MEAPVVIPAKAGIQSFEAFLDPGFRRGNGVSNLIFLKLTALGPTPADSDSGYHGKNSPYNSHYTNNPG